MGLEAPCATGQGFEISHNLLNLPSEVRIPAGAGGLTEDVELAETVFYADGTRAGVIDPGTGEWTSRYIGSLIYSGTDGGETLDGVVTADGFVNRSAWFGFAGKENEMWDAESSTPHWLRGERYQHFGARTYDPASCFFLQTDPLAEKYYGFSPYAYCDWDPINKTDPDGRNPIVSALLGAATEYSFQVYVNYQNGYTGKDAWINQVDFANVGLSAINPKGKFKIVKIIAVNAAKEFIKVNSREGITFEPQKNLVANTAVNSAIDLAVGKAVDTMETLADSFSKEAREALKNASHERNIANNRPKSTSRANRASSAESTAHSAIITAKAYDTSYHVVNDFQEPLRRGLFLAYEQKTDKQRK